MTPENFKRLSDCVTNDVIPPLKEELERLKKAVSAFESSLKQQLLVQRLCGYLINGETMAGFFGHCPTYGMFVRQYRAEPPKFAGRRMELVEVDLIIIPDLLVEHVLRVNIPHSTKPGGITNSPEKVDVPDIVERMLKHARNAKNVSVGTFADVMYEMCTTCRAPAMVVAFDEYLDDDNGRDFTIKRLCGACAQVEDIAAYSGKYDQHDPQYCLTDGIYR